MTSDVPTTPIGPAGSSGLSDGSDLPGLAEGTELAGEFVGAGYREPPLLVYRGDGQVVRLPDLLYKTVRALEECHRLGDPAAARRPFTDRGRLLAAVAGILSVQTGREYAAAHVEFLLDQKLAPLGVTTYSDGTPPELVKSQPMLSLTCRMTMLSERSTWYLAGLFTWLFAKPVLAVTIPLILGVASWTLITQPIAGAIEVTMQSPASILLVVALAIASTGFHEIGHGTACRYGGVRPGVTGCGFYLAWPVFFTDITNTYRLGRGGRLRADFGGVYFNGIFLLGLTALYWVSGKTPFLLAAILSTSLEAVQQLLPTLRFDGYYIIADFVGIPDLFKYIGPIIRRVLLRRPDDGRLAALKRWPQTVVTVWVLLVVPVLIGQLSLLAYNFPGIVRSDWTGVQVLASNSMAGGNPVLGVASATVQILLLLFPLVGIILIAFRLLRGLIRMIVRRLAAAGVVDVAALAGVWGIAWFLGIQAAGDAPDAQDVSPVPVDQLLDESGSDADAGPDSVRERRLWVVDDDDLPAPRHGTRRPVLMPVFGAAAALAVVVILAWTLMPSPSREGKAADLRPNQVVGTPSPVRPGHAPSPSSPESLPASGYPDAGSYSPGKGYGNAPASPGGSQESGSWGTGGAGDQGTGASGSRPSGSGASGVVGTGSAGHGSAGTGGATPGGYGQSSASGQPSGQPSGSGQPSASGQSSSPAQPSGSSGQPPGSGQPSSYGQSPSLGQPSDAGQPAAGQAPAAAAPDGVSSTQPSSTQPSSGQPYSGQPSSGQSPAPPSSSAEWSPTATGPAQGSPSSASPSAPASQSPSQQPSQSPSSSPSPSGSPSGSPSPSPSPQSGTARAVCSVPVAGQLLTLVGVCK